MWFFFCALDVSRSKLFTLWTVFVTADEAHCIILCYSCDSLGAEGDR